MLNKTKDTQGQYTKRAISLYRLAQKERNQDTMTPTEVAQWLREKAPTLSRSSFRQYRSALIFYWENTLQGSPLARDAVLALRNHEHTAPPPVPKFKKKKSITVAELQRFHDHLIAGSRYRRTIAKLWNSRSWFFLAAGVYTGARPIEWEGATLNEEDRTVTFKNAKNTNGRANGNTRTVKILGGDDELLIVKTHLDMLRTYLDLSGDEPSVAKYYRKCRSCIMKAGDELFGDRTKGITLYSGRHQFSANMKNITSQEGVAESLGHASTETAGIHYGKKKSGWPEYRGSQLQDKASPKGQNVQGEGGE